MIVNFLLCLYGNVRGRRIEFVKFTCVFELRYIYSVSQKLPVCEVQNKQFALSKLSAENQTSFFDVHNLIAWVTVRKLKRFELILIVLFKWY